MKSPPLLTVYHITPSFVNPHSKFKPRPAFLPLPIYPNEVKQTIVVYTDERKSAYRYDKNRRQDNIHCHGERQAEKRKKQERYAQAYSFNQVS